jgi:hypothetical protein
MELGQTDGRDGQTPGQLRVTYSVTRGVVEVKMRSHNG